jgi:diguanylate cyclase (GGDEF)-like protein/PAS domain S-box-containing protein
VLRIASFFAMSLLHPSAEAATSATAKSRSWRSILKLAISVYLPLALAMAVMAYSLLKVDVDARLQKLQAQEAAEVSIAEQLLLSDFEYATSDLQFLAQIPSLKHYVNDASPVEKQRVTEHFINMVQTKQRYDQIRYLDHSGMEKIRVNLVNNKAASVPERALQNKAARYFFRDSLRFGASEIYTSPMDLNIEHGKIELPYKPTMHFGTPIFNRDGKKQGVLIINYFGQKLLNDFALAMGAKGHTMLLNHEGYWLHSADPELEWGFMFGRDNTFGKYHPDAWRRISAAEQGSMLTQDGLYTFTTVSPVLAKLDAQVPGRNNAGKKSATSASLEAYSLKIVSLVASDELPALTPSQYPRSFSLFFFSLILLALLTVYLADSILGRRQLRAAIFENEAHLKEITSTLGEGIFVVDDQELTTFVNPEAERLLGWSQAELLGQNAHNKFHYRTLDGSPLHADDCEIYRIMQSGRSYRSNTQVFWRKDGSHLQVDVSASPIIRAGKIVGAVVAFSDIGKQKQAEAALLNSEAQLKQAQRLAQLGSWDLDLVTKALVWSEEIYGIFEIDPGAFGGSYEAFLNIVHPQDRDRVNQAYSRAVLNHTPYNSEHRLLFADGRVKHVIERGETFYDADERPIRSIGTVQDITERKQAEEERLLAERLFHMVFNNVADGIVIHDIYGRFLEVNQIFHDRLGYSREELLKLSPLGINNSEGAAKFLERGLQMKELGQITFETTHISKSGRQIPMEVSARPIEYKGKPATLSVVRDISERKAAQEALRTSKETARTLLNATSESAILMDAAGIVHAVNRVGAKRLRKRPDEVVGRNIMEFLPPDIASNRKKIFEEAIRSGQPAQFQDECNGIHLEQNVYPILDEHGKASHIAIYATDITELIKQQAEDTLLHRIDQQALRSNSLPNLLQFVCEEIVQLFGYQFAWLGKKETNGEFCITAQSGEASTYLHELQSIGVRWDDTPQGRGPAGTSIRSGQMQIFKISDRSFQPWHDAAVRFGFKSIAGIPLFVRGQMYGALMLYSRQEHDFDDTIVLQRLAGIASRICVALEMAMDQEQLRLLSTALASAGNGVFITDARGRIMWINNAFTRLTGYISAEAIGRAPSLLKSGKQDESFYKILWNTIQQGNTWSQETVERHKSGTLFTVQQTITPIKDDDGVISHFVSILDDITVQKETAARIQYMAHFDALTTLPNRALFHDRLSQVLAQAKREGHISALMFIDLDRFKTVNDTLGHHIGDLLLQAVAERLKACVRETDTVSRLGGDEFTVLLPHVHGREDASLIAAKITATLATPFMLEGHEVQIGSSTGIAFYPADAGSNEALIKCADDAMYTAKEQGRGTFRFYRPG